MEYDFLIVGAGFSGAVCANRLAESGKKVLVVDKREHIGGNAHDTYNKDGILIHPYGPHIFHTNSKRIFEYLSRFTNWRFYEHRVLASIGNKFYPIPINRTTINEVFDLKLNLEEVEPFLETKRLIKNTIKTSEDVVLNSVGKELCEMFFRGYTRKQWGLDLSELSAGVAARIPTRTNDDDRYFSDTYQFIPSDGYSSMFSKLLESENITIKLDFDFLENRNYFKYKKLIYTGPIDSYYDYCFGSLPYRSLRFEHETMPDIECYQKVGTINYPDLREDFTRVTEFKHITGQRINGTSIVREFSQSSGEPYYPIPTNLNNILFDRYFAKSEEETNVYFVGRLAQYRYYNMDQVVGAALKLCEDILEK